MQSCALWIAEFCMNDNQRVQSLYREGIYHYPSQVQSLYRRYDSGCACSETWLPVLMLLHDLPTFSKHTFVCEQGSREVQARYYMMGSLQDF